MYTSARPADSRVTCRALDYRGTAPADAAALVADVEADVIGAVTSLVPRLSETTFRPFFLRLYEWATGADAPASRTVTFYRCGQAVTDGSLRGRMM